MLTIRYIFSSFNFVFIGSTEIVFYNESSLKFTNFLQFKLSIIYLQMRYILRVFQGIGQQNFRVEICE